MIVTQIPKNVAFAIQHKTSCFDFANDKIPVYPMNGATGFRRRARRCRVVDYPEHGARLHAFVQLSQ